MLELQDMLHHLPAMGAICACHGSNMKASDSRFDDETLRRNLNTTSTKLQMTQAGHTRQVQNYMRRYIDKGVMWAR
jgi:hypothetical protein